MRRLGRIVAAGVMLAAAAGCGDDPVTVPSVPGDAAAGAAVFEQSCADCHGAGAAGGDGGLSLVDSRFAPPGFDDLAFVTAVVRGVSADEGEYGGMPRIRGLSEQDLADLLSYVRGLQREAGIG
jgi:mono/diheme cytochrome c family protein